MRIFFLAGFTLLVFSLASKAQTADVTFSVSLCVQICEGFFDPDDGDIVVVRGSHNGWSGNNDQLFETGDDIYEGTFPITEADSATVFYKYVMVTNGGDIWEADPNREFIFSATTPTILPTTFFSDDNICAMHEPRRLLFQVDMSVMNSMGLFTPDVANDSIRVYGVFNNWGPNPPSNATMQPDFLGDPLDYLLLANYGPVNHCALAGESVFDPVHYQYFLKLDSLAHGILDGWENSPGRGGGVRVVKPVGSHTSIPQVYFMDIPPEGVLTDSVIAHFSVDMRPAMNTAVFPDPFDPATDSVFFSYEDQFQAYFQGWSPHRGVQADKFYEDVDGDSIYELSLTISVPGYYAMVYRVAYGENRDSVVIEGGGFGFGSNRTRYLWDRNQQQLPAEMTFATDIFTKEAPLVVETHPHGLVTSLPSHKPLIPMAFSLRNYPNPFNPETTIEFTLKEAAYIQLKIYNSLGEMLVVLKNERMLPGTHLAIWNGHTKAGAAASGIYFYQLTINNQQSTSRKMLLLR